MADALMCPHCGQRIRVQQGLVAPHDWPTMIAQCPGSEQCPRSVHDRRPLWNGRPNPHVGDPLADVPGVSDD